MGSWGVGLLSGRFSSLGRRPLATALLLLQLVLGSLAISVALVLAGAQQGSALGPYADHLRLRAVSEASLGYNVFRHRDLDALKRAAPAAEVVDVADQAYVNFATVDGQRYRVSGDVKTGPHYPELTGMRVLHGAYWTAQDIERGAKMVALSRQTSRVLFGTENSVGRELKVSLQMGGGTALYRVAAIFDEQDSEDGHPLALTLAAGPDEALGTLLVRARPGGRAEAAAELIAAARQVAARDEEQWMFNRDGQPLALVPFGYARTEDQARDPSTRVYFSVAALALSVTALGVLAATLLGVRARTRETGLRRALGETRAGVVRGVVLGAVGLTLPGSLAGLGLAAAFMPTLSRALGGLALALPWTVAAGVLGALVLLAALVSLYPALEATRLRPAQALGEVVG